MLNEIKDHKNMIIYGMLHLCFISKKVSVLENGYSGLLLQQTPWAQWNYFVI